MKDWNHLLESTAVRTDVTIVKNNWIPYFAAYTRIYGRSTI